MLCFLFAALIVALDQFFKQWILRTVEVGPTGPETIEIIPGILGLTKWENDGAMLNILSGQQWLLAGIAFAAAVVLVMILLRYNEGFWGTLGLASVLGGTIGNLADRVLNDGKVVDMFRTLFINFPIFNIADIFITLGFITFLIHFIAISFKGDKRDHAHEYSDGDYNDGYDDGYDNPAYGDSAQGSGYQENTAYDNSGYDNAAYGNNDPAAYGGGAEYNEFPDIDTSYEPQATYTPQAQYDSQASYSQQSQYAAPAPAAPPGPAPGPQSGQGAYDPMMPMSGNYEPITDTTPDTAYATDSLESELGSLDDYSLDDLLREYGSSDDDDYLR